MSARMKAQIIISANKYVNKICIRHIPILHNQPGGDNFYYVFLRLLLGFKYTLSEIGKLIDRL